MWKHIRSTEELMCSFISLKADSAYASLSNFQSPLLMYYLVFNPLVHDESIIVLNSPWLLFYIGRSGRKQFILILILMNEKHSLPESVLS